MTSGELTEEELQQSVRLSERVGEMELEEENADTHPATNDAILVNGIAKDPEEHTSKMAETDHDQIDVEVTKAVSPEHDPSDKMDEDTHAEHDSAEQSNSPSGSYGDNSHKYDTQEAQHDVLDDAEADDEPITPAPPSDHNEDTAEQVDDDEEAEVEEDAEGEEEEEEEEAEGVGAVKIKPGETDEEESESDDSASLASGTSSGGSAAEWEEAPENDEEDEDDEEEDTAHSNCVFCKKDADSDPSEDLGAFLTCTSCGEHAHQQCVRKHQALSARNSASKWKCPECAGDEESSDGSESPDDNVVVEQDNEAAISDSGSSVSGASAIQDVNESHKDPAKIHSPPAADSSADTQNSMEGPRVLRHKRKTPSIGEPEEETMTLRKRRRNTSNAPSQGGSSGQDRHDESSGPRSRSGRPIRQKAPNFGCTVVRKSRSTLELKLRVDASDLQRIISQKPKSQRKRTRRPAASRSARNTGAATTGTAANGADGGISAASTSAAAAAETLAMAPVYSNFTQPFYSFFDKETDEVKGKPYGGILTEEQADTSKTLPTKDDRRRFDEAKQKAEEEWRQRLLAMQAEAEQPLKKSKKQAGPASQIECIEFGGWEIDTWYAAPYPEEYSRNRVLYICEFCLKYMNSDYVAWRHKLKCPAKHPPGDEIYRQGSISFFEVDGRKNPVYCQNLCLLAKLFLGSKTLYYDVEPFLFYVLCEYDDLGYHFVGYFSKEKRASSQNNVSCILTLPIHQRKGYGNLLIDFSYLLTRVEEKTGSPEKPLSDMGLVSYRNYWRLIMSQYLLARVGEDKLQKQGLSIRQISDETGMVPDDVISALEGLRCLVRDPVTQVYAFRVDTAYCRSYVQKWESKEYVKLNYQALTWTPYVMGRSNATNFELGPALNTIAPREEEEDPKGIHLLAQNGIAANDSALTAPVLNQKQSLPTENSVLESTEPNDNTFVSPEDQQARASGDGKENSNQEEGLPAEHPLDGNMSIVTVKEKNWMDAYNDIPVTRFQVFPPANPRRPGQPRMSSTLSRPALPRPPPSASRPRPKPRRPASSTTGSARKSASKKSNSKRKPGGTGRGPGRWPKGTKKSDYGNADSGPGLPPGWFEREKQEQEALAAAGGKVVTAGDRPAAVEDTEMQDTVNVQVQQQALVADVSALLAQSVEGHGSGKGEYDEGLGEEDGDGDDEDNDDEAEEQEGQDVEMDDGGDEDADGEEEE